MQCEGKFLYAISNGLNFNPRNEPEGKNQCDDSTPGKNLLLFYMCIDSSEFGMVPDQF
jgi:hypothetical protein